MTLTLVAMSVARSLGAGDLLLPPQGELLPWPLSSPTASPPTLRLAWVDVTGAAEGVDEMARSEARSILQRTGLDVVWRRASAGELARSGEIRVILLAHALVEAPSGDPVLGATPSGTRSHPHVWIHVGSVRAAIGLMPGRPPMELLARARRDLGVALGRVVAHEVVHAVAPGVEHGGELMSGTLTRRELTTARVSFEPTTALAVRAAALGLGGPPRPDTGVRTATGEIEATPVPKRPAPGGGGGTHPSLARDR